MKRVALPLNRQMADSVTRLAENRLPRLGWVRVEAGGAVFFRRPDESRQYSPVAALREALRGG